MIEFKDTNDERTFLIKDEIISSRFYNLEEVLNEFIREDHRDAVLDLTNVIRIDSMSLASLIRIKNQLAQDSRNFNLINPNEGVMRVLELAGLETFLL